MEQGIHLIGAAHLDPVWLWHWQDGCGEVLQTFRSALDRLNEYDDFIFTCSSAAYYKWVEEIAPDMFEEIRQRVAQGRWFITGGWWIQPDCNMPSGESFARQALYSQLYYYKKFGVTCTVGHAPDSFGHGGNLPQLLRQGGMDSYVFMRPGPHENLNIPNVFNWRSPDGSSVKAFRIDSTYCADSVSGIENNLKNGKQRIASGDPGFMLFYGVGNHGGGPTRGLIEDLIERKAQGEDIVFSTPGGFFKGIDPSSLPIWADELQHHASGCYSVTSRIKQLNRRCENALYTAEVLSTEAVDTADMEEKTKELGRAWENVMFNQFHDILGGCSIMEAYDDAEYFAGESLALAQRVTNEACLRMSRKINTWLEGVSDPVSEVRYESGGEFPRPLVVFNPLPFDVSVPVETLFASKCFKNSAGEYVSAQNIRASRLDGSHMDTVFMADLPAMGYEVYWRRHEDSRKPAETCPRTDVAAAEEERCCRLENEYYTVLISKESGGIVSLFDKTAGFDHASWDAPMAVPVIIDDFVSDTWAHNIDHFEKVKAYMTPVSVTLVEDGPVRGTVRVRYEYNDSYLVQEFSLASRQKMIRVKCKMGWKEKHTVVKIFNSTRGAVTECRSEISGSNISRKTTGEEWPMQRWCAAEYEQDGKTYSFGILNDSKYSFNCTEGSLNITLLRNKIFADHYSDRPVTEFNFTDEGVHRCEYGIVPMAGKIDAEELTRQATVFNIRPVTVPASYHKGEWPQRQSFLSVSSGNIVVTALKKCEDGSGDLIIRAVETAGRATAAEIAYQPAKLSFTADFAPLSVKTFRISKGKVTQTDFLEGIVHGN